jgi:hypothetical protein
MGRMKGDISVKEREREIQETCEKHSQRKHQHTERLRLSDIDPIMSHSKQDVRQPLIILLHRTLPDRPLLLVVRRFSVLRRRCDPVGSIMEPEKYFPSVQRGGNQPHSLCLRSKSQDQQHRQHSP